MHWSVGTCRSRLATLGLVITLLTGSLVSTGSTPSPQRHGACLLTGMLLSIRITLLRCY
jgi:hypothetical protein